MAYFLVLNFVKRSRERFRLKILRIGWARHTANWDIDDLPMLVRNGDIDVGGQVAPIQLRGEVLVHVQRVLVDVQLVATRRSALVFPELKGTHFPIAMTS